MLDLHAFASDKINVAKMMISTFDMAEHNVGKGDILVTVNIRITENRITSLDEKLLETVGNSQ